MGWLRVIAFFVIGFFVAGSSEALAQNSKRVIILLRHAEKDLSDGADKVNPELSPEGKLRAQRLVKTLCHCKPDSIFSSNYLRTRATVAPLAEKRKLRVEIYDPRKLGELAEGLMGGKAKCIVVVGHNNTTPALANLLLKQDKYQALPETEYRKIWVITITKQNNNPSIVKDQVIDY